MKVLFGELQTRFLTFENTVEEVVIFKVMVVESFVEFDVASTPFVVLSFTCSSLI